VAFYYAIASRRRSSHFECPVRAAESSLLPIGVLPVIGNAYKPSESVTDITYVNIIMQHYDK
jgi:hypothetical protein